MELDDFYAYEQMERDEQRKLAVKLSNKGVDIKTIAKRCTCIGRPVSDKLVRVWIRQSDKQITSGNFHAIIRSDGARYASKQAAAVAAGCTRNTIASHIKTGKPINGYVYKAADAS